MADLILDFNDYSTHADSKVYGRADNLMKQLGISYKSAIMHPYAGAAIFQECNNIPAELPYYFTIQGDTKVVTGENV